MSTEAKMSTEDTRKEVFELLKKSGDIIISPSPQIQSRQQVQSLQQIQSRQQVQSRQPVQQILKYLEEAAGYVVELKEIETYSPAKEVIVMFTTLLKEESKRTKKKEEIVVIYQLFASAIFCATYLAIRGHAPDDLTTQFDDLRDYLKKFGSLARKYHRKFKSAVVHFLKATDFKNVLINITEGVNRVQKSLSLYMYHQETAEHVEDCAPKIRAILAHFDAHTTKSEQKASDILKKAGGDIDEVVSNDEKLGEIAKVFNEHVKTETKNMLCNWDLDEFLEEDMDDFSVKLDDLREDFKNKNTLIMAKLSAGPHNLIENSEFKKVWEDNKWKTSVKGRRFVDEICGYFKRQFNTEKEGEEHKDSWTLPILTQIMFHPQIVDAIDDDGSGYVSVQEFDTFLKQKPEHWSTPAWFAFWAIGWQKVMLLSSVQVADLLDEVTEIAETAKTGSTDEVEKTYIDYYLRFLPMIRELVSWYDVSGYKRYFATDLQEYYSLKMENLMDDYQNLSKILFDDFIQSEAYPLEEREELASLQSKFDGRAEVWIIPFLAAVLEQHKQEMSGEMPIGPDGWYSMFYTLVTLLVELNIRMQSLERRWGVQKINQLLQAMSFSGGILSAWYSAVHDSTNISFQNAYEVLKRREAEEYDSDTEDNVNVQRTEIAEIRSLRASVSELQGSVAELTRMVQSLLKVDGADGDANATSDANRGQERQNDHDEQPDRGSGNRFNVAGNEFSGGYAMGEVGGNYNEDENPNEENEEYGASNQGSADPPEDEDEGAYTYENSGYEE